MSPMSVLGNSVSYCPLPMQSLLKTVELEIGGQKIDKHYNHWLNTWTELTEDMNSAVRVVGGKLRSSDLATNEYAQVTKAPTPYQLMTFGVTQGGHANGDSTPHVVSEGYAIVPLQFWFCRNVGLALPLIALQYHEVKVITEFEVETAAGLNMFSDSPPTTTTANGSLDSVKLWADYIYLDTDERRRFAQVSHEYLIEQVQYQSEGVGQSFKLNFNHPVKELIWCGQRAQNATPGDIRRKSDNAKLHDQDLNNSPTTMTLKLNGHERFAPRHQAYFTRCQPWTYHSNPHGGFKQDAISVYSFALKPEEHQPSGTCNFSRIDNAQLQFSEAVEGADDNTGLHIYAVNYNVLRIMSGMGGLAYSN